MIFLISTLFDDVDIKNIKTQIVNIFKEYFIPSNFELGQLINLQDITNSINNISGVSSISTVNGSIETNGVNLYIWDVVYDTSYTSTSQNYKLEDFQYAFFYDLENLANKIDIV